jgi:hypothetical protein
MMQGVHEFADKYLTLCIAKLAGSETIRSLVQTAYAITLVLVLHLVVLVFIAFRLGSYSVSATTVPF